VGVDIRCIPLVTGAGSRPAVPEMGELSHAKGCVCNAMVPNISTVSTSDQNDLPSAIPAKTLKPKILSMEFAAGSVLDVTRSVPQGVGSSRGRYKPNGGTQEHPTQIGTSTVSFEAVFEPQNAATLEPISPV